jgi:uncharacterized protein YjiS (DUF1127 family)
MALSLPGERSVAAGSPARPLGAILGWIVKAKRNRDRRVALNALLELDSHHLRDLGISRSDIAEAQTAEKGRTPGMILSAARARSARL